MSDTASAKKTIFVIDDDTSITKLLDSLLTHNGYTVLVAHDGLDGIVQVRKNNSIDLILLDVMMPELNGYDVCRDLKFDDRFKHIPIILLTSREQELDSRIGQLMGIEYIQKPINTKTLLEKVKAALNK